MSEENSETEEGSDKNSETGEKSKPKEEVDAENEEKKGGNKVFNQKLIGGIGIFAVVAAGLFYATTVGEMPLLEPKEDNSEMAFTPEKTFSFDIGEGTVNVYATAKNSSHYKGVLQEKTPNERYASYQKFIINKDSLNLKATGELRRSQLDSQEFQYQQTEQRSFTTVFIATSQFNQTIREKLFSEGKSNVQGSEVITDKTKIDGREAYRLNVSNSNFGATYYISKTEPYIMLKASSEAFNLELTGVDQGVPEAIKQAKPINESGPEEASCTKRTEGFSASDVRISDFGVTSDDRLAIEFRNAAANPINITAVGLSQGQEVELFKGGVEVAVGGQRVVTIDEITESVSCNEIEVQVTYDQIGGIKNIENEGALEGEITLQ